MKTEESIRILISIYVTIEQNFDALNFFNTFLSEKTLESITIPSRQEHQIDEAIIESLWFQIILKACGFLDEWDTFLGIKTNKEDYDKLMRIKKNVAPARKEIMKWKDLKNFRNEIVAHNLRNSKKDFSMDDIDSYNCPRSINELYYLVMFLKRMVDVLKINFHQEIQNIVVKANFAVEKSKTNNKRIFRDLEKALSEVDEIIHNNLNS